MENEEKKQESTTFTKVIKYAVGIALLVLVIQGICTLKGLYNDEQSRNYSNLSKTDLGCDLVYKDYCNSKSKNEIVDKWTGKVVLEDISWISNGDEDTDSLVAFAQKNRRGYFNIRQRTVKLLNEKIVKVYLYKEGRALAESLDSLYILDTEQREIAQFAKTGERVTEVNSYHKGYIPMLGDNGKLGLVDTCGVWAVKPQYDKISWALEEFWLGITNPVMVDEESGKQTASHRIMMDSRLRTVLEGDWTYLMVTRDGYVTVGDKNHWQWHYDLEGNVIDDFVCNEIDQMTYTTGEKKWITNDSGNFTTQVDVEETATLLRYTTSEGWQGLMTKEGKIVTPPVFWVIQAIGRNLYLCKYDTSDEHGILLNDKGERIKTR